MSSVGNARLPKQGLSCRPTTASYKSRRDFENLIASRPRALPRIFFPSDLDSARFNFNKQPSEYMPAGPRVIASCHQGKKAPNIPLRNFLSCDRAEKLGALPSSPLRPFGSSIPSSAKYRVVEADTFLPPGDLLGSCQEIDMVRALFL